MSILCFSLHFITKRKKEMAYTGEIERKKVNYTHRNISASRIATIFSFSTPSCHCICLLNLELSIALTMTIY